MAEAGNKQVFRLNPAAPFGGFLFFSLVALVPLFRAALRILPGATVFPGALAAILALFFFKGFRNPRIEFDGVAFTQFDTFGFAIGRVPIKGLTVESFQANGYPMSFRRDLALRSGSERIEFSPSIERLSVLIETICRTIGMTFEDESSGVPSAGLIGSHDPTPAAFRRFFGALAFFTIWSAFQAAQRFLEHPEKRSNVAYLLLLFFPSLAFLLSVLIRMKRQRLTITLKSLRYTNWLGKEVVSGAWSDIEKGSMQWTAGEGESRYVFAYRVGVLGQWVKWDSTMPQAREFCELVRHYADQPFLPLPQSSLTEYGGITSGKMIRQPSGHEPA